MMKDVPQNPEKITILGGGAMGTALAKMLADNGRFVKIWAHEQQVADQINHDRENKLFLPGTSLPDSMTATASIPEAITDAEVILSVTPSQVLRIVWADAVEHLSSSAVIVSASKGVETGTGKLMSEVFAEILGHHRAGSVCYLSGPSFATEIVAGYPTAVVIASADNALCDRMQNLLSTSTLRTYTTDDVVGVELGGALKNVIAIAVGAAQGLGLGLNTRAALITRGLAEVTRLAVACGANALTLAGLAGMGDLVLTCTGHLSRNLQVGIRLGKGETEKDILASMKMVAEGVATSRSTLALAARMKIDMPITRTVVQLLSGETSPKEAVSDLMSRRLKTEREG